MCSCRDRWDRARGEASIGRAGDESGADQRCVGTVQGRSLFSSVAATKLWLSQERVKPTVDYEVEGSDEGQHCLSFLWEGMVDSGVDCQTVFCAGLYDGEWRSLLGQW